MLDLRKRKRTEREIVCFTKKKKITEGEIHDQ